MQMIMTYSEKTGLTCVACVLEIKVETEGRDSSLLLDYAHPHNLNTIIDFHLILSCMFLSSAPWSSECCTMLWLRYQLLAVSIGFCRFLVKLLFSFFCGIIAFGLKGNQGREFQDDMAIISTCCNPKDVMLWLAHTSFFKQTTWTAQRYWHADPCDARQERGRDGREGQSLAVLCFLRGLLREALSRGGLWHNAGHRSFTLKIISLPAIALSLAVLRK